LVNLFIPLCIAKNMTKALIFLMMTIMMVALTTTISQTHEVYAENKAKDLCSQYDGEWNNGKCKIKNEDDKTDYEDELCDDPKDTKKYVKICKGNSD
jgi:hypothetical protein